MKYISILAPALAADFLSSSLAQKPMHTCQNGASPEYNLGGYDVDSSLYEAMGNFAEGLVMVNHLWRKSFTVSGSNHVIKMWPLEYFNVANPLADIYHHPQNNDDKFAFQKTTDGIFRGVGVKGGDNKEIDGGDGGHGGLYIDFHGLAVNEAAFGIRSLLLEKIIGAPKRPKIFFNETGLVHLYKDGVKLDAEITYGSINGNEGTDDKPKYGDGQEFFYFVSDMEFDAIGFITHSHEDFDQPANQDHDYFLEYLDLCEKPKPVVTVDPHIETWSGMKFDFHGVCDLVLLQNPDFDNGLGMDIQVRTEQLKQFSYVSSAVLRIGGDTLEVTGDNEQSLYWINQETDDYLDEGIVGFLSGYPIFYQKLNSKQHEYTIKIGGGKSIVITTFKKFVRVSIQGATAESFGSSLGLLGSYGGGKMLARDGVTVLEDPNAFGQEWQVLRSEDMLFHSVKGPQAPEKCIVPAATTLRRRRLGEFKISEEEEAQFACSRVSQKDFDICVFDVMATDNKDAAGAH